MTSSTARAASMRNSVTQKTDAPLNTGCMSTMLTAMMAMAAAPKKMPLITRRVGSGLPLFL